MRAEVEEEQNLEEGRNHEIQGGLKERREVRHQEKSGFGSRKSRRNQWRDKLREKGRTEG